MSKIIEIFLNFAFIEEYQSRSTFFDNFNFQFLNDAQFLTARHYTNFENSVISFGHVDF